MPTFWIRGNYFIYIFYLLIYLLETALMKYLRTNSDRKKLFLYFFPLLRTFLIQRTAPTIMLARYVYVF